MTENVPETKIDAYQETKDSGEDVTLRREVAQELSVAPMTVHQLTKKFPERSKNAIRPRVNELLRMGCVKRNGKRTNPSGNEAYVHHITHLGERYAQGKVDPDPKPPVAELRREALETAREFLRGEESREDLAIAVERVDAMQAKMDPEGET